MLFVPGPAISLGFQRCCAPTQSASSICVHQLSSLRPRPLPMPMDTGHMGMYYNVYRSLYVHDMIRLTYYSLCVQHAETHEWACMSVMMRFSGF